jgi:hypothetical protein
MAQKKKPAPSPVPSGPPSAAGLNQLIAGQLGGGGTLSNPTAPTGAPAAAQPSRTPIGVPSNFSPYAGIDSGNILYSHPSTSTVPADAPISYFTGDEWKPASYPTEQIVALQRQLQDAGLLDPPYQLGVWDAASRSAYKDLLALSNARGVNASQALSYVRDAVGQYGQTGKKAQPLTVTLTNPADIASLATQIAVRTIGRRLTDAESMQLAQAYNALERQYQEQAYAAAGSGLSDNATGGTLTQPPNASTYAEQQLREQHPEDVTEMNTINNVDAFRQLLASSASRVRSVG